jgi:hypothetical protein
MVTKMIYLADGVRMKVIQSVLKEELANSLAMQKSYQRELAKLPKGSLVKKNIKGHVYYYLVYRDNGKVRFDYKGKPSEKEINKYHRAKEHRAQYRKLLSEVNRQIKYLRSILRGKKSI